MMILRQRKVWGQQNTLPGHKEGPLAAARQGVKLYM